MNLPKGTAENGATYIHATLFGILSLFKINKGNFAFEQLEKILPITHDIISTTPFVMPNSYSYNEESNMDGESMSDWYTGRANTLIKALVRGFFGINPTLNGLYLNPSSYCAAQKANCSLMIKGKKVNIKFNAKEEAKNIMINGINHEYKEIFLDNDFINKCDKIDINIY